MIHAKRLGDGPLIKPGMGARIGENVNGPSLIRAPAWLTNPLGRYYLYFADHKGDHIRLAFADALKGPWRIHDPGCLDLADSRFCTERPAPEREPPAWAADGQDWLYPHIASPDVHVDQATRQIRMYFHGLLPDGEQASRAAVSDDGLTFTVLPDLIGRPYLRAFQWNGGWCAIGHPNRLCRSPDGFAPFEEGPEILPADSRHNAITLLGDTAHVFWTTIGDAPERIYHGTIDLKAPWAAWRVEGKTEILRPERKWEGADQPLTASRTGAIDGPANQLRDPAIFIEDNTTYMVYAVAGEAGLALARLHGIQPLA